MKDSRTLLVEHYINRSSGFHGGANIKYRPSSLVCGPNELPSISKFFCHLYNKRRRLGFLINTVFHQLRLRTFCK